MTSKYNYTLWLILLFETELKEKVSGQYNAGGNEFAHDGKNDERHC